MSDDTVLYILPPLSEVRADVPLSSDWNPLPFLLADPDGVKRTDLSGKTLRFDIYSRYGGNLIKRYTSAADGGITLTASTGMVKILVLQAALLADLPLSPPEGWRLIMTLVGGGNIEELCRGVFIVRS